jgi:hypothetical protein
LVQRSGSESEESDIESETEEGGNVDLPPRRGGKNATFVNNQGFKVVKETSDLKGAGERRAEIRNSMFKNCLEDEEEQEFLDFVKGASRNLAK